MRAEAIKPRGIYFSSAETVGCLLGKKTNQFSMLPARVAARVMRIME